ncbi:hypothetical protein, partial [Bacillus sp. ISL-55]|uniref:hypothetical protein n=1 Tax=Bacillus sp. ISL-55 TaxID=2819134 RepID=UPI001BE9976F
MAFIILLYKCDKFRTKSASASFSPDKRCPPETPLRVAGGSSTSCASEGRPMKSFFDFIGRTEIEMYSRLPR